MQETLVNAITKLINRLFPSYKYAINGNSLNIKEEIDSLIIEDRQNQINLEWIHATGKTEDTDIWSSLFSVLMNGGKIEISDCKNTYLINLMQVEQLNLQTVNLSIAKQLITPSNSRLKISNLNPNIINEIRTNLVILSKWNYCFNPTKSGQLLISNSLQHGFIYLNSVKLQSAFNKENWTFSYNIFAENSNISDIQIISFIINIIKNTENEIIYSILLEHLDCYEWQIPDLKEFLITEISKIGMGDFQSFRFLKNLFPFLIINDNFVVAIFYNYIKRRNYGKKKEKTNG